MNSRQHLTGIRVNTVFIKFLENMFLILIIPFLILLIMYSGLNSKIKAQTYERNLGILESSVQKIELLFDNMDQIGYYLNENTDVMNYYSIDEAAMKNNITDMIKAQKALSAIKVGNNDILNIQLYAERSNTLIDYFANAFFFERYYGNNFYMEGMNSQQFKEEYLEQKNNADYSHAVMTANKATSEVLVYNKHHIGSNGVNGNSRVIFYVSKGRMLQFFTPLEYQKDGFVCILDENGQMLLNDNPVNYDIRQIDTSALKGNGGYTSLSLNGRKMFITYYRSEARNWLCMEAIPASDVLAVTKGFRTLMFFLFLLAVIVGILLVLLVARKLAGPISEIGDILESREKRVPMEEFVDEIRKLVEHNSDLMGKMQQQISVMRTEAFCKFLTGECGSDAEIKDVIDKIGIRSDSAHYVILLVSCNDINMNARLEEISAQKVFLENIIREQKYGEIQDIYHIDFERMIIFMASDEESIRLVKEKAENLIETVVGIIAKNSLYSISVGGDVVDDALKLPKAFIHSQKALNVPQNVFGAHKVQWYDRARQYQEMETYELNVQEDSISLQNLVLVDKIKKYIQENYKDPQLSLSSVGEEFGITEVYLSKLFKRAAGENFSKYIEGLRMEQAGELIKEGRKAAEVASLVGYNSPQVFRRAWKRYNDSFSNEN